MRVDENNDGTWDVTSDKTIIPLVSKQKFPLSWNKVWTAKPGVHKYEICVDVDGAVAEADENNNCVSSTFVVGGTVVSPAAAPPLAQDLTRGVKGQTVVQLQNYLKDEQYLEDAPAGTYDSATEQAVKDFQTDNDVPITGKWDTETRSKAAEFFTDQAAQSRVIDPRAQILANAIEAIQELLNRLRGTLIGRR